MSQQEFLAGLVLAIAAVPAFFVATRSIEDQPPLWAGLALTVMVAVGVGLRHRLLAGAGSVLLSSVLSVDVFMYGLPYLAYASWLLFRMTRANAEVARVRAEERRARVKQQLAKPEIPVRRGKKGGRVTPPGTPPRPKRR